MVRLVRIFPLGRSTVRSARDAGEDIGVAAAGVVEVNFVAYICEKCGFTELYVADPKKIVIANIPGGRLIRGVPEWEDDPAGD